MSTAVLDAPPSAPGAVRGLRTLLLLTAGLTAAGALGYLAAGPLGVERAGAALWALLPAVVAATLARRTAPTARRRPLTGRRTVVAVLALAVVMLLLALVRVAAGELQGLTNLLLPVALLALVLRGDVRGHLLGTSLGYVDAPVAHPARRLGLFRRSRAGDGGQTTVEAVGVLAVAALVIGLVTAGLMAAPIDEGTEELVCSIQDSAGCGYDSDLAGGPGGGGPGGDGPGGDGPWCSSIGDCALRVLGQAGSLLWQVADAAIDDVVGIVELFMDPSKLLDGLRYLLENPGDALWALVWDEESRELWAEGDYGGAMGRVVWNIASLFIPFANAGKVASALGDLGRLGRIGASADELADLATAGQRAQDAARAGNLDEAADIAVEARQQADDLAERARAAGCLSAGRVDLQVLASGAVRGASVVTVVAGGDLCSAAGDAARRADEAADAAADGVRDGLAAQGPLTSTQSATLTDALRADKMDHVFADKHGFDPLVGVYGSREAVMEQFVRSLDGADLPPRGSFEVTREVGGQQVVLRGAVVDGVPRIGTAFTP